MTADSLTPMAELADLGESLTDDDPRFLLEINTDSEEAVIVFTDYLNFHAELARDDENKGYHHDHRWADLTDSAGYFTPGAAEKLAQAYSQLLVSRGVNGVSVYYASGQESDEEPSMVLEFVSRYTTGETYGSWFDRIGWPIVAEVINCTDPGTFNCPYVMTRLRFD